MLNVEQLILVISVWFDPIGNGTRVYCISYSRSIQSIIDWLESNVTTSLRIGLYFSLNESADQCEVFKEELLPAASTILRLNTKLRPLGRVPNIASRQLVAEFVIGASEFQEQLETITKKKAKVGLFTNIR